MKKIISSVIIISLVLAGCYMLFEPEVITAAEDTTTVSLTVTAEITIDCNATAPLTGTINSITGGTSTAEFSCNVQTPDSNGYNLTLKKDGLLLTGGGGADKQFDDIASTTPVVVSWPAPSSGDEAFGFNVATGTDATARFKYNGASACGSGTITSDQCWDQIPTTADEREVANRTSGTGSAGVDTWFELKAEAASGNNLYPGSYQSIVTSTATINP